MMVADPLDQPVIPDYVPSTLVSEWPRSRTLQCPDPVDKVSAFYLDAADKGGWRTVAKTAGPYSAHLTVAKARTGASISIATVGLGTSISISSYPIL
jgi:hypothetical protein